MQTQLLDTVVRAANAEAGYKNLHRYLLFLHFSFDALYKLKRDNVIITQKFLVMNMVNRRVTIPNNVVGIVKVGIQIGARILPGVPDNSLSLDPDSHPGAIDGGLFPFNFFQFSSGLITPNEAAALSSFRYKLDRGAKQIILGAGNDGDKVYLEVIENGSTPGTGTIIPQEAVIPMKAYLHYRFVRFKMGASSAEAVAAAREYEDELDEALAAMSDLTASGIYHELAVRQMLV